MKLELDHEYLIIIILYLLYGFAYIDINAPSRWLLVAIHSKLE